MQIDQPHIDLVDERGRLQRVAGMFPGHVPVRAPVQFLVDERGQLLEGLLVAITPGSQKLGDVMRVRRRVIWRFFRRQECFGDRLPVSHGVSA